jgi:tight adherence protein B
MWWLMFAAFAGAVAVVPVASPSAVRLRRLGPRSGAGRPAAAAGLLRWLRVRPRIVAAVSGLVGGLVGVAASVAVVGRPGFVPAVAMAVVGVVGWWVVSTERARSRADRETLALCEAFACLADELRAGQRPALALAAAAASAGYPPVADVFGRAAAAAALGGEVAAAFGGPATAAAGGKAAAALGGPVTAAAGGAAARAGVAGLVAAWVVSERAGAPLATVVERLAEDLRSRHEQRRDVLAQLAGPRATAVLLAVLPALGLLLGAGAGARPLEILLGPPVGQVMLLAGACLDALGALWCLRILGSASAEP